MEKRTQSNISKLPLITGNGELRESASTFSGQANFLSVSAAFRDLVALKSLGATAQIQWTERLLRARERVFTVFDLQSIMIPFECRDLHGKILFQ